MRLLLRAGLGVGIGLVALIAVASSVADRGRIAFASTTPLTLTAGTPTAVHVCATGPGDVPVSFLVEGVPAAAVTFAGKDQTPPPASVPAGRCQELVVTAAATADPAAGTLTAVSPGAVARRPFTIVTAPPEGTAPTTEMRGVTLQARRHVLYGAATHLLTDALPFGPYPAGQEMDVAALDAPAGTLAVLEHGGEQAYLVIAAGAPPADARGIVELPVRLEGAGGTGTYRGAFTFTDATGLPQTVAVAVEVGDSIWWCLLAIVLGILALLLAVLAVQRAWPALRLWSFRRRLGARYRAAVKAYNSAVAREDALPRLAVDESSAEAYGRQLHQAYRRVGHAAIRDLLEQAGDDRNFLRDERGLIAVLRELRSAAWRYERARRPGDGTPEARLLRHARRLLEPRALEVGGATALGAEAATFAAVIDAWPKLYERLAVLEQWAADLQAHVATLPAWYQAKLGRARASLTRARAVLLESETPARFGDRALLRYLDRATTTLYEVSAESHSPAWPEPIERQRAVVASEERPGGEMLAAPLAAQASWLALPGREVSDRARLMIEPPAGAPTPPAAPAGVGAAGYLLAVLLAAGGALATGTTEVYSATFGSFGSYLTAFALGTGAAAASTALVQVIATMRRTSAASYARIATADSGR